jgi:hypothetical protein
LANEGIVITGLTEALATLGKLGGGLLSVISETIDEEHEKIMVLAKERTPVDTGALRASGHVIPAKISGNMVKSVGEFGGESAPYALIVHEDLTKHHPIGRAKFYESAMQEKTPNVGPAVRDAIYDYFKSISI